MNSSAGLMCISHESVELVIVLYFWWHLFVFGELKHKNMQFTSKWSSNMKQLPVFDTFMQSTCTVEDKIKFPFRLCFVPLHDRATIV